MGVLASCPNLTWVYMEVTKVKGDKEALEAAAKMQDLHVKQPLQLFRIPCICGGLHSIGSCTTKTITKPTAPTTPTTTSATIRKSRQHGAASEKRRWSEFRRQARRRKFTVDITERHYLTLIKQPCGYCGSRQEG